jgi:hypothetical protein
MSQADDKWLEARRQIQKERDDATRKRKEAEEKCKAMREITDEELADLFGHIPGHDQEEVGR